MLYRAAFSPELRRVYHRVESFSVFFRHCDFPFWLADEVSGFSWSIVIGCWQFFSVGLNPSDQCYMIVNDDRQCISNGKRILQCIKMGCLSRWFFFGTTRVPRKICSVAPTGDRVFFTEQKNCYAHGWSHPRLFTSGRKFLTQW